MDPNHPALLAARNSWAAVMSKDKQAWLALMSDDICVEDPIGVAPTNPTGEGIRGKAALSEFYDKTMAPADITLESEQSFAVGSESAHVLNITTSFPNGVKMIVHGIFIYRIDAAEKITNLRGFWTLEDSRVEKAGD